MQPRTILITGANRGIGLGLCEQFIAQEHQVYGTYRDPSKSANLLSLAQNYPRLTPILLDITSQKSIDLALPLIPTIDILINNAAILSEPDHANVDFAELNIDYLGKVFQTNVEGTARITQSLLPKLMKSRQPFIINISSGAGSISEKESNLYYCYSVSKAGLNMLTRSLAAELSKKNITTLAISPGWVQTDMGGSHAEITVAECTNSLAKTILSLTPEDNSMFYGRHGRSEPYAW